MQVKAAPVWGQSGYHQGPQSLHWLPGSYSAAFQELYLNSQDQEFRSEGSHLKYSTSLWCSTNGGLSLFHHKWEDQVKFDHTVTVALFLPGRKKDICLSVSMHTYMQIYTGTHIHMYIQIHTHIYVLTHKHIHICMHTYTYRPHAYTHKHTSHRYTYMQIYSYTHMQLKIRKCTLFLNIVLSRMFLFA